MKLYFAVYYLSYTFALVYFEETQKYCEVQVSQLPILIFTRTPFKNYLFNSNMKKGNICPWKCSSGATISLFPGWENHVTHSSMAQNANFIAALEMVSS